MKQKIKFGQLTLPSQIGIISGWVMAILTLIGLFMGV